MANLLVILFKKIFTKPKILLLVESDPFLGYPKKHKKIKIYIRRFIAKNSNLVLTNNDLGEKYISNYLGVENNKILVSPYLLSHPPSKNVNQISNGEKKEVRFLYVGRLIEGKGIDRVLNAISEIPKEVRREINFSIIGEGPHEDKLKEIALNIQDAKINFVGKLAYEDVAIQYDRADCLIMNTLKDYRSLVSFEALGFGCAIIGSKFDGSRFEAIMENKNGYIVDPYNIEEIKKSITSLVIDRELLDSFKSYSKSIHDSKYYEGKEIHSLSNGIEICLKS